RVATPGVGVIGSWRWIRSHRSVSSTRLIRKNERGLRMMFGSDPFAGTITERPIGITSGGGSPWGPSRGWRTRVKLPGGSLPITSRTSCPTWRSAAAWSSACSTTAPQNDHEYGTTIPTFISHKYSRPATFWARMTLGRLGPLVLIAVLGAIGIAFVVVRGRDEGAASPPAALPPPPVLERVEDLAARVPAGRHVALRSRPDGRGLATGAGRTGVGSRARRA